MAEELTSEKLEELADRLAQNDKLQKLGLKLQIPKSRVDTFLKTNRINGNWEGTTKMLFDWKENTTQSQQIPDLVKALTESALVAIAEEFFPAEAQRQILARMEGSASSASNANSKTNTSERTVMDKGQMEGPSSSASNVTSSSSSERMVTDKELRNLASRLPSGYYIDVAINLGVDYADYDNIKKQNQSSLKDANFEMLMKWRVKVGGGRVIDLDKALKDAECGGIQYKE